MALRQDIQTLQRIIGSKDDGSFGPNTTDTTVAFMKELVGEDFWQGVMHGDIIVDTKTRVAIGAAVAGAVAGIAGLVMTRDPRAKVVRIAKGQLGVQNPDKYWAVVQPGLMGNPSGVAWCGGFALWALRQAGLTDATWEIGKGFASRLLRTTKTPMQGDIAYFDKPFQHHAIVDRVDGDTLYTVDGNQSPGEQVALRTRKLGDATAFYSIQSLIDAKKGIA